MTLKSRLSSLQSQAGAKPPRPVTARASLQSRLEHLRPERIHGQAIRNPRRMSVDTLAQMVNGQIVSNGLIRIEERLPLNGVLGNMHLKELKPPFRLPGEASTLPSLYIDTETTGLSGGSGTLAFLVGVAEIGKTDIHISQFLITSFAAEPALLYNLTSLLSSKYRLVSYNGKSYDLPLLLTRFRMQGIASSIGELEHLDLLHPVRRLFAKRWENCRLTSVEKHLINFTRRDDLPGSQAPEAWFAFLQRGEGERLIKVVEHNRQDILSLALIHRAIELAIKQPVRRGIELHSLARWLLETNEAEALTLLHDNSRLLCDDGKRLLGYLLRRAERWNEAVSLWEELASGGCIDSIQRLAKYHEHINKDLKIALHYSKQLPGSEQDRRRCTRIQDKLYLYKSRERTLQLQIA